MDFGTGREDGRHWNGPFTGRGVREERDTVVVYPRGGGLLQNSTHHGLPLSLCVSLVMEGKPLRSEDLLPEATGAKNTQALVAQLCLVLL